MLMIIILLMTRGPNLQDSGLFSFPQFVKGAILMH